MRIARYAVPGLAGECVKRAWIGREGVAADGLPVVGPLPGIEGAYVIGCVRGGWTIGLYMGKLLADRMLELEPEMPLFDPARFAAQGAPSPKTDVNLALFAV